MLNSGSKRLNGAHQLLVYADDVNILGRSLHTTKKKAGAVVAARKEDGHHIVHNRQSP